MRNISEIDSMYFRAINDAYFVWIRDKFLKVMDAVEYSDRVFKDRYFLKKITKEIEGIFQMQVLDLFQIDLSVITELSGSYYEGQPCQAELVFYLGKSESGGEGVILEEGIEFSVDYIRNIRKLLQMGREGQCLLAIWDLGEKRWNIIGLHRKGLSWESCISIRILGHMKWEMFLGRKKIVCCECGKYFIDCDEFKTEDFRESYEKTFKDKLPLRVERIFEEALKQKHGTVVVILEENKAKAEVQRLLRESVGMGVANQNMDEGYILGITSIDGAVCIDQNGECYGIGVILDGSEALKGKAARGVRYNSTRKYIKKCQGEKCGIVGMAVVFSEDRSIDIFSTEDILEER